MLIYRALYRKYRPQVFKDVIGQEAITTALKNQIQFSKIGHAYMFTGTRGTGKTTCAKLFAKAVNCEDPQGVEPCGKCVACTGLENGSILDVVEIDAASNNGVDNIRDLRDETAYRPSRCKYKVYIIDEVHMLSMQAFNALLKIMEEPPGHVIFILATTEIHKVPATILSRCQRYDFLRIKPEYISKRLLEIAGYENIKLEQEAASLIAKLADGAMRDALSLLETCSGSNDEITEALVRKMAGVSDKSYLFKISSAVNLSNVPDILILLNELKGKSIDVKRLTEELISHYRNFLLVFAKEDASLLTMASNEEKQQYIQESSYLSMEKAINAINILASALDKMGRSPEPGIELELALFKLCGYMDSEKTTTIKQEKAIVETVPRQMPAQLPKDNITKPEISITKTTVVSDVEVSKEKSVDIKPEKTIEKPKEPIVLKQPQSDSGEVVHFDHWIKVVDVMQAKDRMLYSYMKNSSAYYDGKRILIDGGDMFISYMKEYSGATEKIKDAIEEICGIRYPIGPFKGEKKPKETQRTADDTIKEWEAKGVEVEYE